MKASLLTLLGALAAGLLLRFGVDIPSPELAGGLARAATDGQQVRGRPQRANGAGDCASCLRAGGLAAGARRSHWHPPMATRATSNRSPRASLQP